MDLSLRSRKVLTVWSLLFFAVATVVRYIALAQTPYPNGWDGYYYVMQAHSWLTYGHLQSLDYSLVYPYFTLLSYALQDYVSAFKIGASLLSGGLVLVCFRAVYSISKKPEAAVFVAAFLLFSPTITYMVAQFPKNVLGLIFMILFLKAIWNQNLIATVGFFLLTLLTHRMTGGMVLVIGSVYALRKLHWKWVIGGLAIALLFSLLPGIIHFSDLKRFDGQFSFVPQLAPYSFYKLFQNNISIWWAVELGLMALSLPFLFINYIQGKDYNSTDFFRRWIFPLVLTLSVFPFFIIKNGSMGFRFFMITPVLVSLYLAGRVQVAKAAMLVLTVLFLVASAFSYQSYDPAYYDPPNRRYEIMVERLLENYYAEDFSLVIAHKSLAEMIIYKTEFDALNWSPPENIDQDKVLRIVHNLDAVHFSKYLSKEEMKHFKKLTLHYYITPEKNWLHFLSLLEAADDVGLLRRIRHGNNPLEARPYFLRKGKKQ